MEVDEEELALAVKDTPGDEVGRGKVRLGLRSFADLGRPGRESEPKRGQFLFEGAAGTGKSFGARRIGFRLFDEGRHTMEIAPTFSSTEELIRLSPEDIDKKSGSGQGYRPVNWANSLEMQFGVIPAAIIKGYRIFLLDEGEKFIISNADKKEDLFLGLGKKEYKPDPIVKYLLDRDVDVLTLKIGGLEIVFPWDDKLLILTTNTKMRDLFSTREANAIQRRFDAAIEYINSSESSLQAAFEKGAKIAMELIRDPKKRAAIDQLIVNADLREQVIRSAPHSQLRTPALVNSVASLLIDHLNHVTENIEPKDIRKEVDMGKLTRTINSFWRDMQENFPLDLTAIYPSVLTEADIDGGNESEPPTAGKNKPKSKSKPKSGIKDMPKVEADVAAPLVRSDFIRDSFARLNASLETLEANQIARQFMMCQCRAQIMHELAAKRIAANGVPIRIVDQQVGEQALQKVHTWLREEPLLEKRKAVKKSRRLVAETFTEARDLSASASKQRGICLDTIDSLCKDLDAEVVRQLRGVLLGRRIVACTTGSWNFFEFATQGVLIEIITAVFEKIRHFYDTAPESPDWNKLPDRDIDEIIANIVDAARARNGQDVKNARFKPSLDLLQDREFASEIDTDFSDSEDHKSSASDKPSQPKPLHMRVRIENLRDDEVIEATFDGGQYSRRIHGAELLDPVFVRPPPPPSL